MNFTELHRHLDASIRLNTLFEMAVKKKIVGSGTSLSSFKRKILVVKPMRDLKAVLSRFVLFQKVLDRPEVLERVAFEAVEDCHFDGISKVEFRFSPSFVSEKSGMSWVDILLAFENGLSRAKRKFPKFQTGLICIASRDYGPDSVESTIEFFLKHQKRFIGIDLAGDEKNFPGRLFEKSFQKAIQAKANITIHAGEASGPDSVWEAIELLGAKRIGHGIASYRDSELVRVLARKKICLEVCPTSNWITGAVESLSKHPLPFFLKQGVPVCINTDDPGLFGNSLSMEFKVCRKFMKLSAFQLKKCLKYSNLHSFIASDIIKVY